MDEDVLKYYRRGNQAYIVGDNAFRSWIYEELLPNLEVEERAVAIHPLISMEQVVNSVAIYFKSTPKELRSVIKGPQKGREARKLAMYLCQEVAAARLTDIAGFFHLGHIGSVSFITHQIRKRKAEDRAFARKIGAVIGSIMKKAN